MNSLNDLSYKIIGSAMEVYKTLGPGLLESAYEKALVHELNLAGIPVQSQVGVEMSRAEPGFAYIGLGPPCNKKT